jgi:hypothetical protein
MISSQTYLAFAELWKKEIEEPTQSHTFSEMVDTVVQEMLSRQEGERVQRVSWYQQNTSEARRRRDYNMVREYESLIRQEEGTVGPNLYDFLDDECVEVIQWEEERVQVYTYKKACQWWAYYQGGKDTVPDVMAAQTTGPCQYAG